MSTTVKKELLGDLLRGVSRSFYLSLKWLPGQVRDPISIAYLLARTSDTIADTAWIPAEQRLDALRRYNSRLQGADPTPLDLHALVEGQGDDAERILLHRAEEIMGLLEGTTPGDQRLIRTVLKTIVSGQTLDLERFAPASETNIVALEQAEDLEDYTYRVAGCVGEFWTRVCLKNLKPHCPLSEREMIDLGVSYGRGLQLINILRDLPRDLRQGRCYLPKDQLEAVGLAPSDLLDPTTESRVRPIHDQWLSTARSHLDAGWQYTNAWPRSLARIRISCALPILIGWKTLSRLGTGAILDPQTRIKIPRGEVQALVMKSFLAHPVPTFWRRLARAARS